MFSFSNVLVPFLLPLSWGLGYAVTTGMKVFDRYFPGKDVDESCSDQTDSAGEVSLERATDVCEPTDFDVTEALQDDTSEERTVFGHTVTAQSNATGFRGTTVNDDLRRKRTAEKTDLAGEVFSLPDLTAKGFAEVLASAIPSLASPEQSSLKGTFNGVFELPSVSGKNGVNRDVTDIGLTTSSLKCKVSVVLELQCSSNREAPLTETNISVPPTSGRVLTLPKDKATLAGIALSENESRDFGNSLSTVSKGLTNPAGDVNLSEQQAGPDILDVVKTEAAQQGQTVMEDKQENFFKFSNVFQNSWVNASFQSILNLSVTRRCLAPERVFIEASSIPCCAGLLHSAVHNPGKHISPEEISPVLTELKERNLCLGRDFEISCLLETVLVWLDSFGGNTDRELYSVGSCTKCDKVSFELLSKGPLVVLPPSTAVDNIAFLFRNWVDLGVITICPDCGTRLNHKHCLTDNNVLVLFLPESARCNKKLKILPNKSIDVPGECATERYHLSSVICGGTDPARFHTYIVHGQKTVKAADEHIFTADSSCSEDMFTKGFMFVYEKRTP